MGQPCAQRGAPPVVCALAAGAPARLRIPPQNHRQEVFA